MRETDRDRYSIDSGRDRQRQRWMDESGWDSMCKTNSK